MGAYSEEQGECFHEDIMRFEQRCQGQYNENMMGDARTDGSVRRKLTVTVTYLFSRYLLRPGRPARQHVIDASPQKRLYTVKNVLIIIQQDPYRCGWKRNKAIDEVAVNDECKSYDVACYLFCVLNRIFLRLRRCRVEKKMVRPRRHIIHLTDE
ncbi:hypothetical protein EVAR_28186_1 [Eumeta japonica]|uniref:Uncharacterized protein n=1 Tax=Eumeta variegata TaxID=151549 RepID=A0A4C1VIP5_EUMVA|nr:hypothetical protein EVAR_28186_1 [Eumeta japonica]